MEGMTLAEAAELVELRDRVAKLEAEMERLKEQLGRRMTLDELHGIVEQLPSELAAPVGNGPYRRGYVDAIADVLDVIEGAKGASDMRAREPQVVIDFNGEQHVLREGDSFYFISGRDTHQIKVTSIRRAKRGNMSATATEKMLGRTRLGLAEAQLELARLQSRIAELRHEERERWPW